MAYGYEVKGPNDQKVKDAKTMVQIASERTLPGALLVNDLPFCQFSLWYQTSWRSFISVRYIPEWLPWLSYKPFARYGYNLGQEVLHGPMGFVRETLVSIWAFKDGFENSLFASSTGLLNRHLLSRICKRQRNSRNQNAKRQKK
jgi:hypothetical protein